ncbi:Flp family type IVb pilin [Vibrio splendidus]|uniref:Flp family type IVb pilin n=1 Tax=Vibrio lentus TaxID=136468 RepID=A0A4U2DWR1_9VIBR|nr:Flp family type IVb pilin [Vibrio lentus]PHN86855.1 Flp family type IVb pilin [Vibrio splendidus]PML10810.1 fimbrial protein [Vibrio lentus]TKF59532.1 Flp family type IVb pilin [Vibrio lentus]TKF94280.1 Flp family type IVb pilin [Vibrio lentus]TKG06557.1 Flp family type IVb pilin [Vibrio lentus]
MNNLLKNIKEFMSDEEGLTVVEYVIGAAMLVFGLTSIFGNIGTVLGDKLSDIVDAISTTSAP